MTEQKGRDNEEQVTRADGMTTRTGTGPAGIGNVGGTAGASHETTGAGSTWEQSGQAEQSTAGQGGGTDMAGGARTTGSIDAVGNLTDSGAGRGTAPAMRVTNETDATAGMGTGTGDDDGIGAGADMDPSIARGDMASTGTAPRAGLGGPSSGNTMDADPAAGSGMANPADMGDQG